MIMNSLSIKFVTFAATDWNYIGPIANENWKATVMEIQTLMEKIGLWDDVNDTPDMNVIDSNWAFQLKRCQDGMVDKYRGCFDSFNDGIVKKFDGRLFHRGDNSNGGNRGGANGTGDYDNEKWSPPNKGLPADDGTPQPPIGDSTLIMDKSTLQERFSHLEETISGDKAQVIFEMMKEFMLN